MEKEKKIILNENNSLKKIVLIEKESISKKREDFVSHVSSSKINNNISILKKNIDCLGSILSQCAFKHNKLKSIFCKKQVPHIYAHTLWHTHAHTTHMYTRVYTCTHCDRKGHLAKFYFDRLNYLNFANKNIWAPYNANPRDPTKRYGYQNPYLLYMM